MSVSSHFFCISQCDNGVHQQHWKIKFSMHASISENIFHLPIGYAPHSENLFRCYMCGTATQLRHHHMICPETRASSHWSDFKAVDQSLTLKTSIFYCVACTICTVICVKLHIDYNKYRGSKMKNKKLFCRMCCSLTVDKMFNYFNICLCFSFK